jgi:lipopolysaccharide biosynthesis glycosyltransferase
MIKRGVVTTADKYYYDGCVALVNSIKHNTNYPITIIDCGLTLEQKNHLSIIAKIISSNSKFNIAESEFGKRTGYNGWHFFRLNESEYDQILFLDSDTLLLSPVDEIFDKLTNYDIAGHKAISGPLKKILSKNFTIKYDGDFETINAGVVFTNKNYFSNIINFINSKNLLNYSKDYILWDQSLLNLSLSMLNSKIFFTGELYNFCKLNPLYYSNRYKIIDNNNVFNNNIPIKILHFIDQLKPWHVPQINNTPSKNLGSLKKLWDFYRNMSFKKSIKFF